MGLLQIFSKKKGAVNASGASSSEVEGTMVELTSKGKKQAEAMAIKEPQFSIMARLLSYERVSIGALVRATGMPIDKVRAVVNDLITNGMVQKTGGGK